ncbi:YceD family protein [Calditerricola satsumensis]|uniref:DUF177 domain-containing protein n=2 Tax=Calditerricola satsumensis TaxID=373054 RepID=A0A8J3FC48_9BACI|nr:YceD family protein [Calditerricola satsumensis]GGK04255.1 hypothetical protein GCM10007043_17900 [Calditerricola satsumensis]
MMILRLPELEGQQGKALRVHEVFAADELARMHPQVQSLSPVTMDGEARYEAGEVRVHGTLSGSMVLSCSRCLKAFPFSYSIPVDERFVRASGDEAAAEEDDEENVHVVEGDTVDLKPYLVELIALSVPFAPLCDEACKGLCPLCGIDRNAETCSCRTERIDPRLAVLAELFADQQGQTDKKEPNGK